MNADKLKSAGGDIAQAGCLITCAVWILFWIATCAVVAVGIATNQ